MRPALVTKSAAAVKTKLNNGLTVVAQENNGAVSQLILAFRAGSRYQSATQQGLVHHIRNFVGRDAQGYPGLQLVWSGAASGAEMNSFATRDILGVHLSVPRDHAPYALQILGHLAAKPAFKPWELDDVTPSLHTDLSTQKTSTFGIVFEGIHRAAYRNDPLGSSIFSSRPNIGAFKTEEMSEFAKKHFVAGNGVLIGVNVDQETLKNYGEGSGVIEEGGAVKSTESKFRGGDYRISAPGSPVHIIIAGSGSSISDIKKQAVQSVFLSNLGTESPLQFSSSPGSKSLLGSSSKLPKGVASSGFHVEYEGSGLCGVYLVANGSNADAAVRATVEVLRNGGKVTDLEGCKRRSINSILFNTEKSINSVYSLSRNSLFSGPSASELISEIQKVESKDLEKFAKESFNRLAISSYGNHGRIPYYDEL